MNRGIQRQLKLEQFHLKEEKRDLLRQRSMLGKFKGKARSPEDRVERNRLESEISRVTQRIAANAVLLPPRRKGKDLDRRDRDRD